MLKNRLAVEDIRRFRVLKDVKIKGKYSEHEIDIFFQFVQMNNIEKSIVKVIENKIVTSKDVWEFYTVVNDLRYFAKGIIYYKGTVSHEVKLDAERAGIELIYFDLKKEIAEYVAIKLKKCYQMKMLLEIHFGQLWKPKKVIIQEIIIHMRMELFLLFQKNKLSVCVIV